MTLPTLLVFNYERVSVSWLKPNQRTTNQHPQCQVSMCKHIWCRKSWLLCFPRGSRSCDADKPWESMGIWRPWRLQGILTMHLKLALTWEQLRWSRQLGSDGRDKTSKGNSIQQFSGKNVGIKIKRKTQARFLTFYFTCAIAFSPLKKNKKQSCIP